MKDFFTKLWKAITSFFKNEKNSIIKPTIVLLCICIVIPLALAVTNKITAPKIADLEKQTAKDALEELVDSDGSVQKTVDGITFDIAQKDGENVAFVFTTKAKGYGGKDSVTVMTAISPTGEILNLKVLDVSNETPGLGQNAKKESWYKQFIGMSGEISITDIDTLTSATITSKAVMTAVNEALELFDKVAIVPNQETGVITPEDSFAIPEEIGPAIPEDPSATTEESEVPTDEK